MWNEEDTELGHAFCEEFYPAYIKAASNEKAQINLGKTLTNEGDEFCRISCYLRRTNMSQDENAVCFPDCDPAFIEKEWNDSPMDDAARCAVLKECFRCRALKRDEHHTKTVAPYDGGERHSPEYADAHRNV